MSLLFGRKKPSIEFQHQVKQHPERLPAGFSLFHHQFQRCLKITLFQTAQRIFYTVPNRFRQFPFCRIHTVILFGWQAAKRHCRYFRSLFFQILTVCQSLQLFDLRLGQFAIHIRTVRQLTQLFHFHQFFQTPLQDTAHTLCQILSVITVQQGIQISRRIIVFTLFQPFCGPGKTSGIAGQVQDMLFQHALSAAGAEIFHTGVETFPCLPGWVPAVTFSRNLFRKIIA